MAQSVRHRLPATGQAAQSARALVAAQLNGALTLEQKQVAQLLVSELVTNALAIPKATSSCSTFGPTVASE